MLKRAVRGMLPKNRLRDKRLDRLKVFEGVRHPYSQNVVRFEGKQYRNEVPGPVVEAIETPKTGLNAAAIRQMLELGYGVVYWVIYHADDTVQLPQICCGRHQLQRYSRIIHLSSHGDLDETIGI